MIGDVTLEEFRKLKPKRLSVGLPGSDYDYFTLVQEVSDDSLDENFDRENEVDIWQGHYCRAYPDSYPWDCRGWYIDWVLDGSVKKPIEYQDVLDDALASGYYWGYINFQDEWLIVRYDAAEHQFFHPAEFRCRPEWIVPVPRPVSEKALLGKGAEMIGVIHEW